MAPPPLKRLISIQQSRADEVRLSSTRLREKERSTINIHIVSTRLAALNKIWDEARSTHEEIISRDDVADCPYIANQEFAAFQALYEELTDFLLTLQSELEAKNPPEPTNRSLNDSSFADFELRAAKLPKLDLPAFSGDNEDWENFRDLFTTLVHNAPRLAEATKLQYLKSCLKGTAADLVKNVATTNANYLATWQALKARFHNPRVIVFNHLWSLLAIPHLQRESAADLRLFADEAQRIVRALKNLNMPIEHWDIWFVFILSARLDPESRKVWESELGSRDRNLNSNRDVDVANEDPFSHFPKFTDLAEFLEKRARTLGMIASEDKHDKKSSAPSRPAASARKAFHASAERASDDDRLKCPLCSGAHRIFKCYKFKSKTPYERRGEIRRLRLCFNCFGPHLAANCTSAGRCAQCNEDHHTMIHPRTPSDDRTSQPDPTAPTDQRDVKAEATTAVNTYTASLALPKHSIILTTAQVRIVGPHSAQTRVRALLDQGAETSFILSAIAKLLQLPSDRVNISLNGLGNCVAGTARYATKFSMPSLAEPGFRCEVSALVLPKLTSQLPARRSLELNADIFREFRLADPLFYIPDSIDVILGADVYGQLLRSGVRSLPPLSLVAQNTTLGWIISGPVDGDVPRRAEPRPERPLQAMHCVVDVKLDDLLQQFWTLEEVPRAPRTYTAEEEACEKLFRETHKRDADGRFIVRLPFRAEPPAVAAETRRMALDSLVRSHRRFARDARLAQSYRDFMKTYEELGHMERVPAAEVSSRCAWYLPHHAVVSSGPNGKIRVVFDASRKTSSNCCLNDFLLPGPALQRDLSLILLNWGQYRFVFSADIIKMFRQIRVIPEHQDFQRIVWSPSGSESPVDYRLLTVTYGAGCSPFLAIRVLLQIAADGKAQFPLGASCLEHNTYVDDTFAGADELSTAIRIRDELISLLQTAGVELDKWSANHPDLLPTKVSARETDVVKMFKFDDSVKTLGVAWNPSRDQFVFTTSTFNDLSGVTTKRSILSNVSRLFDPLGWIAPVTVIAKILMQDLWLAKCEWDAPIPPDARERWLDYCQSLAPLSELSIDRWLGTSTSSSLQIHGFADASRRAYAAAVYVRVEESDGSSRVSLLAAKSKVAPVKTVSVPNLELCGAALLVKLINHVRQLDFVRQSPIYAWTDSQIALTWLKKHPCHWKTFVANRVSFIQTELPKATWAHVPTTENPADLATRGCKAIDLRHANLWWHGPAWLAMPKERWPKAALAPQVLHARPTSNEPEILLRFSSLTRLTRVVAYCLRPLNLLRRRKKGLDVLPEFLTAQELSEARTALIRLAQVHAFTSELELLENERALPKRSSLLNLNPILDRANGLLRVGGRLANANLPIEQKHPPILPRDSALSRLFVRHAHRTCLHGGPTLTSSTVMRQVWILGRNRLVKTECRNCVICQRVKPRLAHQMMGDLPATRVTAARPFSSAGLDYAGPFQIRTTKGRGHKSTKGYIALFVCFATRAIHLEAVSDLTTQTFLAAYKRFVGRRGICRNLYSDNATTFRAADKQLQAMFRGASDFYKTTAELLAGDGTNWTFIPPSSPHYGGLWEAGVKSVKHHLRRAFGERIFTFEEFSTVLIEIEACLNSRPLCPLSSDADDLNALSPSHFLLGEAAGLVPDDAPSNVPENRLERFHLLQVVRNAFWDRWSSEYMQQLQERNKWREPTENFAVGQLVLVRDDRYSPAKWPLARVVEVHPGPDNLVRVVSVKTATSTLRRHIARLCPVSIEQPRSSSTVPGREEPCIELNVRPADEGGRNVRVSPVKTAA